MAERGNNLIQSSTHCSHLSISLYLSISLSLYLYISLFIYLYFYLSIYLSLSLSMYQSISLFPSLCINLSFCVSLWLSLSLSISLSLSLSLSHDSRLGRKIVPRSKIAIHLGVGVAHHGDEQVEEEDDEEGDEAGEQDLGDDHVVGGVELAPDVPRVPEGHDEDPDDALDGVLHGVVVVLALRKFKVPTKLTHYNTIVIL